MIVVYASAAFVLIELVNNVYETLNLPQWTPALTLILLLIGILLAVIFSRIFEISSKGLVKTKSMETIPEKSIIVLPFENISSDPDQKRIELEHYQSLRIAYALWQVGKREEAMEYINRQISLSLDGIEMVKCYATEKWAHYDLAAVYAFLGDTGKAYQYLTEVKTRNFYPLWWRDQAKYDLLFERIRGTPQYQDLLQHMENCYQAEHERVRQWLEENHML